MGLGGPHPNHEADYNTFQLLIQRPACQLLLKFSQRLLDVFDAELCQNMIRVFQDKAFQVRQT